MPQFRISKPRTLVDETVDVKLCDLNMKEHSKITLYAYIVDKDIRYSSVSYFVPNQTDMSVDLSREGCLGGSYLGVDSMAFIWSMQPEPGSKEGCRILRRDASEEITVHLEAYTGHLKLSEIDSIKMLCASTLERCYLSSNVDQIPVKHGRVRGTLFLPKSFHTCSGIIDVFGMAGGNIEFRAALIASKGYACLALAYFGYEDLPGTFNQPDMSYFEEAVDFLLNHPRVHGSQVGTIGVCKGGELVLLMASFFGEKIAGTIAINANPCVMGVPIRYKDEFLPAKKYQSEYIMVVPKGISTKEFLEVDQVTEYIIPVERSPANHQFLLVSSLDDHAAPLNSVDLITERLNKAGRTCNSSILRYSGAGHLLEPPFTPQCDVAFVNSIKTLMYYGGRVKDHHLAQVDFWGQVQTFFANILLPGVPISRL